MIEFEWFIENWLKVLSWFVIQIIIHELGHYIAYRYYNHKPKIEIKWYGIVFIGESKDYFKFTPKQYYIISMSGIMTGLFYTMLVLPEMNLVYLLMCIIDISIIISALSFKLNNNKSMGQLQLDELNSLS